ncbi:glycoside hydrolase family 3 protein [Teredinibacter sp. KSP-S5-2]|uniref:glycoside hydrolase family 3 protein n=1 Tax=Teredinibacter sp. KSP-S5-2 TaxID=3034506 RepID=UPI0029352C08|nr:glycoside hydrolase family 3 N-terminal domain-containing protein [Teredinibacter sp. KSP-S5-2]WNO10106.1 glycoside hydrolase family 3 N-terminal domain-containing protein [Teredinibacter sp. KSP-S5-2]
METINKYFFLTVIVLGLIACDQKTDSQVSGVEWPSIQSPIAKDKTIENRVTEMLEKMTLEEKVGQMMQPEVRYITPEQVKQFHIGSVLNGGGSIAGKDGYATLAEWVQRADDYYYASVDDSDGAVPIPIFWGTDSMHGASNIIGATIFPHNIGLGAMRNPELMEKIGHVTAIETLTSGVDWLFAPTVAVVRNDRWGRTYESFSENPEVVKSYAAPVVKGIQGKANTPSLFAEDRLLANVKHFLGDGGTQYGIDQGNTMASEKELRDIHGQGYFSALAEGAQVVMASFNSWNGEKVHGNKHLLTDVLKNQMGFDGFVVSDWNGHGQVKGCSNESCPQAINAGIDMVMVPSDWQALIANTIESVKQGDIPMSRIDDAVTRILRVKMRMGLFDRGAPSQRKFSGKYEFLGSDEHRAVARQSVRESLVLLKNNQNILPLSAKQKVLVAGPAADDIGWASGGWTVTWQGVTDSNKDFPDGTSIYQGIKAVVEQADGQVELNEAGNFSEKPDVAIVVYGEKPYAEMQGDIKHLGYQSNVHVDLKILNKLKDQGIPVVSVFLSGRPLWVNKEINASDAFVAAWLPGSEGQGVADVLFSRVNGEMNYDFSGKLSFSWPKYRHQEILNWGDENYDPLFAYGFGLTYQDKNTNLDLLPEDVSFDKDVAQLEPVDIFVGRPVEPWQAYIQDSQGKISIRNMLPEQSTHIQSFSEDKTTQGDSRRVIWQGDALASLIFESEQSVNLAQYVKQNAVLSADVRVLTKPVKAVSLQLDCGEGCKKSVDLTETLKQIPGHVWTPLSIELDCLSSESNVFDQTEAFAISTEGSMELVVANLRVEISDDQRGRMSCDAL